MCDINMTISPSGIVFLVHVDINEHSSLHEVHVAVIAKLLTQNWATQMARRISPLCVRKQQSTDE